MATAVIHTLMELILIHMELRVELVDQNINAICVENALSMSACWIVIDVTILHTRNTNVLIAQKDSMIASTWNDTSELILVNITFISYHL